MADLASDVDTKGENPGDDNRGIHGGSTTSTPRWVKVFGIVVVVMALLFVVLHLTDHGLGGHTLLASGAQQP